ncbi:MAG: 50S ribosomal protein L15 [Patescibacteria group bacterium]|nr:MAG: 50S ribosomal protein L15 [Patescibacteria group bacterium]
MQIHQLKRNSPRKKGKLVGRGGRRGKTSGKGMKGQKSRAGRKLRPEMRDIIKKLPKRRGYGKNRARTVNPSVSKPTIVNVSLLDNVFSDGEPVTPSALAEKGVLKKVKGRLPHVKILGAGVITKKVIVSECYLSGTARRKIESAGGSIK